MKKKKETKQFKNYLKIARLDHWIKQLFIAPGIVFAIFLLEYKVIDTMSLILNITWGFLATSFIASANYIINEWLDAEFDKYHPTKKDRPVVAANLKTKYIILEYIIFTILGLICGYMASNLVLLMVGLLWIMGIVYNVKPLRSKEIPYVDVLSESINNAIRLLIGWFIVSTNYIPPISIVIGYWMGGAFLMAAKRFAEYRMINNPDQAGLYRKSFKYYTENSLLISAFFYAMLSVFFSGIFMLKYRIELLLAIPALCGLFCIYFNLSFKYDSSAQKPEKLFKEKGLLLYIVCFIILTSILMFVKIPILGGLLDKTIIGVK